MVVSCLLSCNGLCRAAHIVLGSFGNPGRTPVINLWDAFSVRQNRSFGKVCAVWDLVKLRDKWSLLLLEVR